ncbi:unnamed protein product [Psylliodes chrysocephalus]|uniref:Uncharacterized protein n=1 Tax=Psylliodes chrysocephalus TaxID=3402493 RepID=A0A9P0DAS8_9CUCU|nr:unnamed protein product [Psylliodes chrysocephala]
MAVWLWSKKDNHYTLLLGLVSVLFGFRNTMGAPVESRDFDPWWTHPCTGVVHLRHARSGRSRVEIEFKILNNNMQNTWEKMQALYQQQQVQSNMRSKCPRMNLVLALLNNRTKKGNFRRQANHIFYQSVVELSKFVNQVKQIPINTEGKLNLEKRRDIYDDIELNLRSFLCTYNESISRMRVPPNMPTKKISNLLSTRCLPKSMDLTRAQMFDYDLIKKLKRFFNQSSKKLDKIKKKNRTWKKQELRKKQEMSKRKEMRKKQDMQNHVSNFNHRNNKRTNLKKDKKVRQTIVF